MWILQLVTTDIPIERHWSTSENIEENIDCENRKNYANCKTVFDEN